ncbi:ATP-dependent nuclease [Tardiphaga sp. 538_B7_N1_4]|uniref:ATP-dependent nuclease n=1 Tax=Tardiphaga sp. 538_B7_N1_4 TaxID=3240778 RepID=UPI003F2410D9
MSSQKAIDQLSAILAAGKFAPFIEYVRFPRYKNLARNFRIDFDFPVTALVGPNGTNKSSILVALQGAPANRSPGQLWFSTAVDPIEETGDLPNSLVYGYKPEGAEVSVEVLKVRIADAEDPDLWETSRPLKQFDMEPIAGSTRRTQKTRQKPVRKNVVHLDFRQSLSAFDKFFYHSEPRQGASNSDRKAVIRARSPHLLKALNTTAKTQSFARIERIREKINRQLNKDEVEAISKILGRRYTSIQWIRHFFFNVDGYTCVLHTDALNYSEAFAGSGEFAVVRLVVDILAAPERSLILLDEPEVSLHPGAQSNLVEFLFEQTKLKKHQVVMATHSPAMIRHLPPKAIKIMSPNLLTGQIELLDQSASPAEAFHRVGEPLPGKKSILVEDGLAREIVLRVIRARNNEGYQAQFDVRYNPGGSKTLWAHLLPTYAAENRSDILVLLDGDERRDIELPDPDTFGPAQNAKLVAILRDVTGVDIKFNVDGGIEGGNTAQENASRRTFIKWARENVKYLPTRESPEEFVWNRMAVDKKSSSVPTDVDHKKRFATLARLEVGRTAAETVNSAEILATQQRRLTDIDVTLPEMKALSSTIDEFAAR